MHIGLLNLIIEAACYIEIVHSCETLLIFDNVRAVPHYYSYFVFWACWRANIELLWSNKIYLVKTHWVYRHEIYPESHFSLLLPRLHDFQRMSFSWVVELHSTKLIKNSVLSIYHCLSNQLVSSFNHASVPKLNNNLTVFWKFQILFD